jgi:hypothetical protein
MHLDPVFGSSHQPSTEAKVSLEVSLLTASQLEPIDAVSARCDFCLFAALERARIWCTCASQQEPASIAAVVLGGDPD